MTKESTPLAAVILAHGRTDAPLLRAMADATRKAGAQPVVIVLARSVDGPTDLRIARVGTGASTISAARAGMALLTNTPAHLALLWPLDGADAASLPNLVPLIDGARSEPAAVIAFEGADLDKSAVIVSRDSWLDVVTLGEQGLDAVAARRGVRRVRTAG